MKIKLLIRRAAGSTVELDGVAYTFNEANDHTCEVDDENHARRLLEQKPAVFVEADAVASKAAEADKPAGGRKKKAAPEDAVASKAAEA